MLKSDMQIKLKPKLRIKGDSGRSIHESAFLLMVRDTPGLPEPTCEYVFAPPRKWRADFAWKKERILVEIEGGIYTGGYHVSIKGYTGDCEKYNYASMLGWVVLRFTPPMLYDGTAMRMIGIAFHLQ